MRISDWSSDVCSSDLSAAAASATALAAEEGVHDVGEGEASALAEAAGAAHSSAEGVTAAVIGGTLLRIAEHLVGQRDLFEALLCLRVRVDVGVQLSGQFAVGLLDRIRPRVADRTGGGEGRGG